MVPADDGSTDMLRMASEAFAVLREVKDYAIYVIDPQGRVLTWNKGAEAIKGYAAEEIIGHSFTRFFTEADRTQGRPAHLLSRAAADGRVEDETWRIRKDGSAFWADVVITAVHDAEGHLSGFIKVTRDLTERRRAEELLRQSEERFRLLVDGVNDYAIYMLDTQGVVTTWNSGAERIKGYTAAEIVGKRFSVFYPPEAIASRHPEHELEIARAEGRYEEEGWRVRKNGERFWASVVLSTITDPDTGELRGFAKVTRDLTEQRRMQEETRSAVAQVDTERARVQEARLELHARDEFISVAAHELRTPLTALVIKLQGAAELLHKAGENADGARPARLARRLDGAVEQIGRLSDLVERLLDVSRIVSGNIEMSFAETNLTELVRRVAGDFRDSAAAAGSDLRVQASGDVIGRWDAARLGQVVTNLLSNAIKYGGGKPIDVEAQGTDTGARIVVRDQGIGIAPDDADRIFTRFERAAPVRHYGGLGLGLYIAKNIVELHGGSIHVSSRQGDGSTFVVELPRRAVTASDAHPGERPETRP